MSDTYGKIEIKPEHAWNLDSTLAQVLDQGLTMMMNNGNCETMPGTELARDCFRAYVNRWDNGTSAEYGYGAETECDQMMAWALNWLKDNFYGLWD